MERNEDVVVLDQWEDMNPKGVTHGNCFPQIRLMY